MKKRFIVLLLVLAVGSLGMSECLPQGKSYETMSQVTR